MFQLLTMRSFILGLLLSLVLGSCSSSDGLAITSPDEKIMLRLKETADGLNYTIKWREKEVISSSRISIFQDKEVEIVESYISDYDQEWKPIWGQFSTVSNHYKELKLQVDYQGVISYLYVRVYDKGVGFRFEVAEISSEAEPSYLMEYNLSVSDQVYMPAGEGKPIGPLKLSSLSDEGVEKIKWKMPIVLESGQGPYISLLESDLVSSPGFDLVDFRFDKESQSIVAENTFSIGPERLVTPWRVILIEENLGDLVTSQVTQNLAAPSELENTEWIKPGKAMWDWRVHGFTTADGFTYGIDTESYFRFIDFASENEIEYFLIDDAWYTDVSKGSIVPSSKLDLESIRKYAEAKGVSLMLYYDQRKGDYGDQALFPFYRSMGMRGIKYGFMGSNVDFTREAIRLSAESELLINFHDGPVPLTGVSRTFPNAITREYNHAQQDARRTFTPETFIKMALINAIQGPLDMNNGIFDIKGANAGEREKGPKVRNSLVTTAVAEAARTLIIFSGIVCLPDAPEAYYAKSDLFEFIKNMPVGRWDESMVLNAKMGETITTARRSGTDWFVGSVSSIGGKLEIPLDFLAEGEDYEVTFYEDTEETNSETNPEEYRVRKGTLKKGALVRAEIAKGGGHCMWLRAK